MRPDFFNKMVNLTEDAEFPLSTTQAPNYCGILYDFIIEAVLMGILCLFGFAGNIISMVCLWRDKSKTATPFLLISLEIADTLFLMTVFALRVLPSVYTYLEIPKGFLQMFPYLGTYVWPIALWATTGTIWITVLVTVNRYVSVCRPYEVSSWCSVQQARRQVVGIWVVSLLYNLPRFFEFHISPRTYYNQTWRMSLLTELGSSRVYKIFYGSILYCLVMFLVPLITLIILNWRLIKGLRRTRTKRAQLLKSSEPSISRSEEDITFTLIVVVVVFVVCQAPALLTQIIQAIIDPSGMLCPNFFFYYVRLSDLMVVLNSSINFLVYCFCSDRFRTILLHVVCHMYERPTETAEQMRTNCRHVRPTTYTTITVPERR